MTGYDPETWYEDCDRAFIDIEERAPLDGLELERLKTYLRTGVVSPRGIAHLIITVEWQQGFIRSRVAETQHLRSERDSWNRSHEELRKKYDTLQTQVRSLMLENQHLRDRLQEGKHRPKQGRPAREVGGVGVKPEG